MKSLAHKDVIRVSLTESERRSSNHETAITPSQYGNVNVI